MRHHYTIRVITAALSLLWLSGVTLQSTHAEDCFLDVDDNNTGDITANAESNGIDLNLACGRSAIATGTGSTAVGNNANATGVTSSTAVGNFAKATAAHSTAVGVGADAGSEGATTLGKDADVFATDSPAAIVIGNNSDVGPAAPGAIAIGGDANFDHQGARADGAQSIALGAAARTGPAAGGGIAIGGDVDGDGVGAHVSAANSIAIGADVVADIADNVFIGYPVRVVPKTAGVSERVLMRLVNSGGVNFKLNDISVADGEWTFRTGLQGGKFVIGKTGSGVQELQVFTGGNVSVAGTLTQGSSRTGKENIRAINTRKILDKVLKLPVSEWNYIHDSDHVKHIGPMAEDFYAAFRLGATPKGISSIDTSGIALAAVQALQQNLDEKQKAISAMQHDMDEKDNRITQLETATADKEKQIIALEQRLASVETDRSRVAALERVVESLLTQQQDGLLTAVSTQ